MSDNRGTLKQSEPHPAARSAFNYIRGLSLDEYAVLSESFASTAIEGNRLGEICSETLERLSKGEPVSDRYLLGLAWAIKATQEA